MDKVLNKRFSVEELKSLVGKAPIQFISCDFSSLNLLAVDFSGCIFDNCNLQKTRLRDARNTKFYSCDLRDIDLSKANITGAYAVNCRADRMNLIGAKASMACDFLSGLRTERESDGWRLIYLAAQVDSPAREAILSIIPPKVKLLLETQFSKSASY